VVRAFFSSIAVLFFSPAIFPCSSWATIPPHGGAIKGVAAEKIASFK